MVKQRSGDTDGENKRTRKPQPVGTGYDAPFRGYINLALDAQQKANYESWSTGQGYWEALEGFTADGVNLSLKFVAKEACFLASGTQRREDSPNAGLVVTARGKAASTALGRLLFTLTVLAHSERWEDTQPLADPDRW